ncbi:MAG: hypothetical protein AB9891_11135 [Anaerolineaceae bacterium]
MTENDDFFTVLETEILFNDTNRRKWTFVWCFLTIFLGLAWWDLYQGFILIGNPPSFVIQTLCHVSPFSKPFPFAFWGYVLWVICTGKMPDKFVHDFQKKVSRKYSLYHQRNPGNRNTPPTALHVLWSVLLAIIRWVIGSGLRL